MSIGILAAIVWCVFLPWVVIHFTVSLRRTKELDRRLRLVEMHVDSVDGSIRSISETFGERTAVLRDTINDARAGLSEEIRGFDTKIAALRELGTVLGQQISDQAITSEDWMGSVSMAVASLRWEMVASVNDLTAGVDRSIKDLESRVGEIRTLMIREKLERMEAELSQLHSIVSRHLERMGQVTTESLEAMDCSEPVREVMLP